MIITANKLAAPAVSFAGKGKAARTTAMAQIAPLSFVEDSSRAASLANARLVLGNSPDEALTAAVRLEYVIGRVASRLPASECRKGKLGQADRLELARDIVTRMAAAPVEGKATRPLRKGQIGRRSTVQQTVMRNAESAAVLFFADLGLGKGGTMKAKTAKAAAKRAPSMAGSGKGVAAPAPAAPNHTQLVAAPTKAVTADDVLLFLGQQSKMLTDYINRNAKVAPTDASGAVNVFRTAILTAANALQERKAIARAANKGDAPTKF